MQLVLQLKHSWYYNIAHQNEFTEGALNVHPCEGLQVMSDTSTIIGMVDAVKSHFITHTFHY